MPSTYTPIATTTLNSSQSTVSFNSISNAHTDLVLSIQARTDYNSFNDDISIYLNNDQTALYSSTRLLASGNSAISDRQTGQNSWFNILSLSSASSIIYPVVRLQIFNYSNTTTFKTALWEGTNFITSNEYVVNTSGLYRSTNAISQITIKPRFGSNLTSGSTFSLYGIKAA